MFAMADQTSEWQTKASYIIAKQLEAIEKSMAAAGPVMDGYHSFARSFNKLLHRSKNIFANDRTFTESISQLRAFQEIGDNYTIEDFECLKAEVAILKATVFSFFDVYSPRDEKEQIGFHAGRHEGQESDEG